MPKKTDMILKDFHYYMDFLRNKQKECKNRGFPKIKDEDIEKKIKDLNDLKGIGFWLKRKKTWILNMIIRYQTL